MARLSLIDPAEASPEAAELLGQVEKALGIVPNMTKAMANSPAALRGYIGFSGALGGGKLSVEIRERLALGIAEKNGCTYCLSAHTYLASNVAKISDEEIEASRNLKSGSAQADAALRFAGAVAESQGKVSDEDLKAVREAGFSDGEIAEIVAHVALNIYTNYFNNTAQTDVDFPVVQPLSG
jgi:uncharacterized peroxidase-related enzyme